MRLCLTQQAAEVARRAGWLVYAVQTFHVTWWYMRGACMTVTRLIEDLRRSTLLAASTEVYCMPPGTRRIVGTV
jgi:hypothetical protein